MDSICTQRRRAAVVPDLDPWQHGVVGQILERDPNEGPIGITDDSFEAWLKYRL